MPHTSIVLRARFFACPSLALRLKAAMRARLAGESAVLREVAIVFWASLVELADSGTSPPFPTANFTLLCVLSAARFLGLATLSRVLGDWSGLKNDVIFDGAIPSSGGPKAPWRMHFPRVRDPLGGNVDRAIVQILEGLQLIIRTPLKLVRSSL